MQDFYLTQIKVVGGYPELEQLHLKDDTAVLERFMLRMYRSAPREEWDEVHRLLQVWSLQAQNQEMMFPKGEWHINLGGDKVRSPEVTTGDS